METQEALFELIAIAVGSRERLSAALDRDGWDSLLETAKKQSLVGVLTLALDKLPQEQKAPLRTYARWMLETEKIQEKNAAHRKGAECLYQKLEADGVRSCILKGQGMAQYYPQPDLRQCGDVDIWIAGEKKDTVSYFKARYPVRHIVYHHFEAKVFDNIPVEVHFTPSWMNSPVLNRRLQKFFADNAGKQFGNMDEELGFCVPRTDFNAVYAAIHIFRHLFYEGIGLRQLMDYHYVLKALEGNEKQPVMSQLKALGLGRFTAALMYVMTDVFKLEEKYLLCAPDEVSGKAFLDEVMRAGNFGIYDERNHHDESEGLARRAWRRLSRLAGFLRFYPREVLNAPVFKVWQYFWRRGNDYL